VVIVIVQLIGVLVSISLLLLFFFSSISQFLFLFSCSLVLLFSCSLVLLFSCSLLLLLLFFFFLLPSSSFLPSLPPFLRGTGNGVGRSPGGGRSRSPCPWDAGPAPLDQRGLFVEETTGTRRGKNGGVLAPRCTVSSD
jgi:hypothetical protein